MFNVSWPYGLYAVNTIYEGKGGFVLVFWMGWRGGKEDHVHTSSEFK
jgi:hypothetical protein